MAQYPSVLSMVALVLLATTCFAQHTGPTGDRTEHPSPTDEALRPVVTTSELVVGYNRFAFGLLKHDTLLEEAGVVVRVYEIADQHARLKTEVLAPYEKVQVMAQGQRVHIHPDGARHIHSEQTDIRGLYVTHLTFDQPGTWGLEVRVQQGNQAVEVVRLAVHVLEAPATPAPGSPAPRSRNRIASDVSDLRQLDTSNPPDPRLHQVRIADAIAQGKPQVLVFATPQLCTTRLCGPVLDVVRTLIPLYSDRVVFTHEEIWQDASAHQLSPTVMEWGLQSEPWIFVVDRHGIVQAKFEGLTTERELEGVLQQMLAKE